MHADRPGDRPRLLYWYRTAPGIALGRAPLDEDAIRTIEEQHPDIDFDWPAILALSEVMTPEDEAAPRSQPREQRPARRRPRDRDSGPEGDPPAQSGRGERVPEPRGSAGADSAVESPVAHQAEDADPAPPAPPPPPAGPSGLVEQLAGREIAARLRGRYAEIAMRIQGADPSLRESMLKLSESLDPDRWDTPDAVLQGVSHADALFERLRAALHSSRE